MSKIPTKTNNKMTMSHHNVLNKTWNQQIYQQQKKKKKAKNELTLKSFLDECGAGILGLEGALLHHSILGMDDISSHWK